MLPKVPVSTSISRLSNHAHRDLQQPSADPDEHFWGPREILFSWGERSFLHSAADCAIFG